MEYCAGGDLSKYLKQNKRLTENLVKHFLQQLGRKFEIVWINFFNFFFFNI